MSDEETRQIAVALPDIDIVLADYPDADKFRISYHGSGGAGYAYEFEVLCGDSVLFSDETPGKYWNLVETLESCAPDGYANNAGGCGTVSLDLALYRAERAARVTRHHSWYDTTLEDANTVILLDAGWDVSDL